MLGRQWYCRDLEAEMAGALAVSTVNAVAGQGTPHATDKQEPKKDQGFQALTFRLCSDSIFGEKQQGNGHSG